MSIVLGINAYHADSSACIVVDGKLLAAAEEERFRRIKHWAGVPTRSVAYCLEEAGVRLSRVDHLAINSDPKANLPRKVVYTLRNRPDARLVLDRLRGATRRTTLAAEIERDFPGQRFEGETHRVEHHLAHLASAFMASPFEEAAAVSVDGFGDFSSAAWGVGSGDTIEVQGRVFFPHSLGIFYQAMTQFLGFPHYGDEYKVMGLAPYGEPTRMDEMRRIVRLLPDGSFELALPYFRHHVEKVPYQWDNGVPKVGRLYAPPLSALLGEPRDPRGEVTQAHKDIARSTQAMYEEAFFNLLGALQRKSGLTRLAVAGGCGMNSVANGKIRLRSAFDESYIQSAAGDAGGAIGAALVVASRVGDRPPRGQMPHAYWGPRSTDDDIARFLSEEADALQEASCSVERYADEGALCAAVAAHVADGKVVGWFHGRMEWGPRALGGRSIICDPRRTDMKDLLNLKIKRRESFRPFAPSVLREAAGEWFEQDDDVPFMMKVFQIRPERRGQIPAVTHVDGSGRLQTVDPEHSPRYHRLISAFRDLTGVPMVLNTSFNENEPVVCKPSEALACFLRTRMDVLVLENHVLTRPSSPATESRKDPNDR